MADFNSTYGDNPWEGVTDKTRDVYVADLLDVYRRQSMFRSLVPFKIDLRARSTQVMTFTTMYDLEPITDAIGNREHWFNTQGTDSEQKSITMEHHSGKVTLHKFDEMINQWRASGASGLRGIVRNLLAQSMVEHLDVLARNAFLEGTWHMYGRAWADSSFAGLDNTDTFDPTLTDDIFLGMQTRGVSGAVDAAGTGETSIIAITTPGVVYTIQQEAAAGAWQDRMAKADPSKLLRYEVGSYRNVRYLSNPSLILWNAGDITFQGTVVEPLYRGAGAARNVDANRVIGQEVLANGNRYIQMDALDDLSAISPGDVITIHTVRTSVDGVTNGVNYRAGTNTHRRVVAVDNSLKRITVDKPILKDAYTTDLGSGVYAYVTKGVTIHPTIFLTAPNGVVAGVGQPPQTYVPPVLDDANAFHRFSWDAYLKYQIWNDHAVEVSFNTAPYRMKGARRF